MKKLFFDDFRSIGLFEPLIFDEKTISIIGIRTRVGSDEYSCCSATVDGSANQPLLCICPQNIYENFVHRRPSICRTYLMLNPPLFSFSNNNIFSIFCFLNRSQRPKSFAKFRQK